MSPSSGIRLFGLGIPGLLSGREEDTGSQWDHPLDRWGLLALSGEGSGWRRAGMESFKLKRGSKLFL